MPRGYQQIAPGILTAHTAEEAEVLLRDVIAGGTPLPMPLFVGGPDLFRRSRFVWRFSVFLYPDGRVEFIEVLAHQPLRGRARKLIEELGFGLAKSWGGSSQTWIWEPR